jgi:hypothetical protein
MCFYGLGGRKMKMEIYPTAIKIKLPAFYDMYCPRCNKQYKAYREGKNGLTFSVTYTDQRCRCGIPFKLGFAPE